MFKWSICHQDLKLESTDLVKKMEVKAVLDPVEGVRREVVVGRLEGQRQLLVPGRVRAFGDGGSRASALDKRKLNLVTKTFPFTEGLGSILATALTFLFFQSSNTIFDFIRNNLSYKGFT